MRKTCLPKRGKSTGRQEDFKWVVDSMNEMVDGVEAKLAWHFCLGTAYGNTFEIFEGKLEEALSHLHDVNIEQYVLDFALRDMQDLGALRSLPQDKEVAVGVIDVRVLHVESEEEVAERIRKVLEIMPAEQVWLTTDCGLRALPRIVAREKLRSLVGGADIVRREIGDRSAGEVT